MVSVAVFSQDNKKNIYSGGMLFYQPGFTISKTNYQTLKDNSNSIGGMCDFTWQIILPQASTGAASEQITQLRGLKIHI